MTSCKDGFNEFWEYIVGIFTGAHSEWVYYFWAIIFLVLVIVFHDQIKAILDFMLDIIKTILKKLKQFFQWCKKVFGKRKKKASPKKAGPKKRKK